MIQGVADKYKVPLVYAPPHLCSDNAAMIAWMGWELINAEQDVDIADRTVNALKRIPLGSYVEGFIQSSQDIRGPQKVMTTF